MTKAQELYPEYNVDVLLKLIRDTEAPRSIAKIQGKDSQYDVVWHGIHAKDRPASIRKMSVNDVLAFQDSIDSRYNSEALGAYQILEDTLRSIPVDRKQLFDEEMQDTCAIALLERRGLKQYLAGELSIESFALGIAKEWASFPIPKDMMVSRNGRAYSLKWGDSYYSHDANGNKSLVEWSTVKQALEAIRQNPQLPSEELSLEEKVEILWAAHMASL